MNTNVDAYRQQLLFALRARNVPGPRIGEAIAEVESHIAETNEDPVAVFGPPAEYAQRLAESLAHAKAAGGTGVHANWSRGRGSNLVVGIVAFAGAALAVSGWLQDAPAMVAIGLVLFVGLVIWVVRRRGIVRIVDPRTGSTLRVPAPRWALAVLAVSLAVLAVLAVAVR